VELEPEHPTVETNDGLLTAQPGLGETWSPGVHVDGSASGSLTEGEYHTLPSLTFYPFSLSVLFTCFPVFCLPAMVLEELANAEERLRVLNTLYYNLSVAIDLICDHLGVLHLGKRPSVLAGCNSSPVTFKNWRPPHFDLGSSMPWSPLCPLGEDSVKRG
jgi:hypothetical protein